MTSFATTWQGSIITNPSSSPRKPEDVTINIAKVAEQQQRQQQRRHTTRTAVAWVKEHPWWSGLILLLILICITAIILLSICATRYCPNIPLWKPPDVMVTEPQHGPPRLMLKFVDLKLDALTVLPAVLRSLASRVLLDSSNIQVLQFIDEATLNSARDYFQSNSDLQLLVRDFSMWRSPLNFSSGSLQDTLQTIEHIINTTAVNLTVSGNGTSALDDLLSSVFNRSRKLLDTKVLQPYTPNDLLIRNGSQWFHSKMQSDYAWLLTKGSPEVVVAIVDTGVDLTHPDLQASLWVNEKEIPGNGIDDDGNGFIDDVNGWDFAGNCTSIRFDGTCECGSRATPSDDDGHGTHVAGLVASVQNNWQGGSGVAPNVKLMILRVSDCVDDTIYASAVVAAYDYALKMGAHVVQCSFGMSYPDHFSPSSPAPWYHASQIQAYVSAITPMNEKGMLVVAAAGNEYLDLDTLQSFGYAYSPCLVNLSNVLCVAASDSSDQLGSWSNYGAKTVHVAAPGTAIMSTILGGSYAFKTGTSMAAPIVSGIGALAVSILGSTSGVYYHGSEVKKLIMTHGDNVPGMAVAASRRVNAFNVSLAALAVVSSAAPDLILVKPSVPITSALPLSIKGCTQTYINVAAGTRGMPLQQLPSSSIVDMSVGSAAILNARNTFKYGSGKAVVLSSYVLLTSTGLHTIQISSSGASSSSDVLLLINGSNIQLSDGSGSFQVASPGYFDVEIQLLLPTVTLQLSLTSPSSSIDPMDAFFTVMQQGGQAAWAQPASSYNTFQPPGLQLLNAWHTHFSITRSTIWIQPTSTYTGALLAASPSYALTYVTLLPDLNFGAPSMLSQALLQGAAASDSALATGVAKASLLGRASARLDGSNMPSTFVLRSTCTRCIVWLEGLMVIDNWEGLPLRDPMLVLTKDSACITLPPGSNQPLITVTFTATSLTPAQLTLSWMPCGDSSSPRSLASSISSSALWQTGSSNATGSIGGLQCDVWRSGSLPALQQPSIPPPLGARDPGAPDFKLRKSRGLWSHSLMDLLPGIEALYPPASATASPHLLSVRCWTYLLAPSNLATSVNSASASVQMQLGGRRLLTTPGKQNQPPTVTLTDPGLWSQLLVVEWENVPVDLTLTVSSNGAVLPLTPYTTTLPLLVQQLPDTSRGNASFLGPNGHFSITRLADSSSDVTTLTQYAQSDLVQVGSFSSPDYGLNGVLSYGTALGSQLRYTVAEGYYQAAADGLQLYTFRLLDDANTSSTIVMAPGVSVLNARAFSPQNPRLAMQVSVMLPGGYIYTEAVVKTMRPDGQTPFYVDVSLPYDPQANADGVVDNTIWYHVNGRGY